LIKDIPDKMERIIAADGMKQEFEQTLSSRVERYLKVKPHAIAPLTEFAPVSAECTLLFRDGHFYGSIALSQSVAEGIVNFLCQKIVDGKLVPENSKNWVLRQNGTVPVFLKLE
jgi:hypothetical protein